VRVSPTLTRTGIYPFARLEEAKRAAAARGVDLIDLGVGDPREQTEEFIQRALVDALPRTSGYPLAQGLPELRGAITRWCARRFGVDLDPDAQVIPTLGSKEAIFSFAQVLVDPEAGRDLVAVTEPGYPVPERGALFAGAEPLLVPLHERNGFLPDLDSIPEETWQRLALFWVNYPNNPTGATAPRELLARLSELARRHDFVLAADEAYSELWYEAPPASVLELGDLRNVVAFNTLSKRSSMTGYRSGFVAGDAQVIGALRTFRPTVGTAPQEFVQRASVAAWDDEAHVERTRGRYARKRALFSDLFARKGVRLAGSVATIYLWFEVPAGENSEAFATRLLEHGIVVSPGSYFGATGEGYARIALVPSLADCERAVSILEDVL